MVSVCVCVFFFFFCVFLSFIILFILFYLYLLKKFLYIVSLLSKILLLNDIFCSTYSFFLLLEFFFAEIFVLFFCFSKLLDFFIKKIKIKLVLRKPIVTNLITQSNNFYYHYISTNLQQLVGRPIITTQVTYDNQIQLPIVTNS